MDSYGNTAWVLFLFLFLCDGRLVSVRIDRGIFIAMIMWGLLLSTGRCS